MFESNNIALVETIKSLLLEENENIFDFLDFENDDIYQDPALFSYFNFRDLVKTELDQIIYGYISPEIRPSKITVHSNRHGVIYIPNYGYLHTEYQEERFFLITKNQEPNLYLGSKKVPHRFEPIYYIENTSIEILLHEDPIFLPLFRDYEGNLIDDPKMGETADENIDALQQSFTFIHQHQREMSEKLHRSVKRIVLFNHNHKNSFASLSAQGAAFFNLNYLSNPTVYFIDDIAHQCGHVYFYVRTFDKATYFNIDPGVRLSEIFPPQYSNDGRQIYTVFHALYTYTQIIASLESFLNVTSSDLEKSESIGRICFYIWKFGIDLEVFQIHKDLLSEKGKMIYRKFLDRYFEYSSNWSETLRTTDFSNQPYNFSFSEYRKINCEHIRMPKLHSV